MNKLLLVVLAAGWSSLPGCAYPPLFSAVESGHTEQVQRLLAAGTDVNDTHQGATALMHAARQGRLEMARLLLDAKADPNVRLPIGSFTALYFAVEYGHPDVARLLLERGASVDPAAIKAASRRGGPMFQLLAAAPPAKLPAEDVAGLILPDSETRASVSPAGSKPVQSDREFAETAAAYRAAFPKPRITEEVRRLQLQAEVMIGGKRFMEAMRLYQEALKLAPWWPDGRFNRALVLGELKRYSEAITEMNRFLQLEENAPEARSARDKIYQWEAAGKVGEGGRQ